MSTVIMAKVWPLQMPPSPKSVLVSLADNANDAGECFPSITTIGVRTCLGKTAVMKAIAWLEEAGFVRADRSNGRHSRYSIVLDRLGGDLFTPPKPVREAHRYPFRASSQVH